MPRARTSIALVLAACLLPAVAFAQKETERVHKVVPLGAGGTFVLKNFSGNVRITGTDAGQVTIDAVRRAERDRLEHIKLDVQASGSTVTVEANKKDPGWEHENNNVVETEFDIQVPRDATLDLDVFSSPVLVTGVSGAQNLHSFSGKIEAQDASSHFKAKTFSGGVQVRFAGGGEAAVDVETFSGTIELGLDALRGKLEFNTFSGDLRSDLPLTLQRQSRRQLIAELGGGGGQVKLRTFSGNVQIVK